VSPSLKHFREIGAFSESEADAFIAVSQGTCTPGVVIVSSRTYYTFSHRNRAENRLKHADATQQLTIGEVSDRLDRLPHRAFTRDTYRRCASLLLTHGYGRDGF